MQSVEGTPFSRISRLVPFCALFEDHPGAKQGEPENPKAKQEHAVFF